MSPEAMLASPRSNRARPALPLQVGEVGRILRGKDASPAALLLIEPGVVGAQNVVGHAEDVEAAAADEVDELAHARGSVAPGGVRVELGEQWGSTGSHDTKVPVTRLAGG
jgi:hypothetical protein